MSSPQNSDKASAGEESKPNEIRRGSSKTFVTKTESGKKLRVTFREGARSESQDSSTSQSTVVENPPPPPSYTASSEKLTGAITGSNTLPLNEAIFDKLKKELVKEAMMKMGRFASTEEDDSVNGQPRVTVLRRASITPSMTLTRSASSAGGNQHEATSSIVTSTTTTSTTSGQANPVVKTVSFATSVTGDVVGKEMRVAFHKRQSSLNGTESTSAVPPPQPKVEHPPLSSSQSLQPTPQPNRGATPDLEAMPSLMKQLIAHFLASNNETQQADLSGKMAAILEQAWNRGGNRGVEIAEVMCRDIRNEGALTLAFSLASSHTVSLRDLRLSLLL